MQTQEISSSLSIITQADESDIRLLQLRARTDYIADCNRAGYPTPAPQDLDRWYKLTAEVRSP